jgi:excisionase family DNA binding protein
MARSNVASPSKGAPLKFASPSNVAAANLVLPLKVALAKTASHAARLLGVSRSAAYRAAASGQLPTITFGRRLLVPTSRLLEMLGLPAEEQP